jgi:hypothetical protein
MGAAAIIGGIGLGLQVAGQVSAANAQRQQYQEQARVYAENADLAEKEATEAMRRGTFDEYRYRGQAEGVLGAQRAAYGASGVAGGTGSAADVEFGSRVAIEQDAAAIRFNARNEEYGKKIEAYNYRRGVGPLNKAAGAATAAGLFGAGSTLLTGMSQLGLKWNTASASSSGSSWPGAW